AALEEARQELLRYIGELRARLLIDPELSEPLLDLFQKQLMFSAVNAEPHPAGTVVVELRPGGFAIRYVPGLPDQVPWDWRRFPLAGETVVRLSQLPP